MGYAKNLTDDGGIEAVPPGAAVEDDASAAAGLHFIEEVEVAAGEVEAGEVGGGHQEASVERSMVSMAKRSQLPDRSAHTTG